MSRLRRKFRCGICGFRSDEIHLLEEHVDSKHACVICGLMFCDKRFHRCRIRQKDEDLQVGFGSEPIDSENRPIFQMSKNSFDRTITSYTYVYQDVEISDILQGVEYVRSHLEKLLRDAMGFASGIRFKLSFEILFYNPKDDKDIKKRYTSVPFKVSHRNFISDKLTDCATYLQSVCDLLSHEISGLLIKKLMQLEITIMEYRPHMIRGYIPISNHLRRKRGLINVRIRDSQCFAYSVACALHIGSIRNAKGDNVFTARGLDKKAIKRVLERPCTWTKYVLEMQLPDGDFFDDFETVEHFEILNDVSVSILKYCRKQDAIVPLRMTKLLLKRHVFLLKISRDYLPKCVQRYYAARFHFVAVYDLPLLMAAKSKGYKHVCRFCFAFSNDSDHETRCHENDLATLTLPKTVFYTFNDHFKLCMPPTFFVYQLLFSGDPMNITVTGFCLVGMDANLKIVYNRTYVGDSAMNIFLDELLLNACYYLRLNKENQIPLKVTPEHMVKLKSLTHCYVCGEEATVTNMLVPNHDHHSKLINGFEVEGHQEGFPFSYPCKMCNLKMFPKRRVPVYGYNLSYHTRFILRNVSERGIKSVTIIPLRTADCVGSLIINNMVQFIDLGNHFNNERLHSIFQSVDENDLYCLKHLSRDSTQLELMKRGFPYPSFVQTMPSFDDFTDVNYLTSFTKDDYEHVLKSYDAFQCKSLTDYGKISLETDVYGLVSLLVNYARYSMSTFGGMNPCWDISISGFAYSVLHYVSKTHYRNLDNGKLIRILEDSILPGISLSNAKRVDFQSRRLNDNVKPNESVEALMVDIRSQFASILLKPVPVDGYHYMEKEEVENFKISDIDQCEATKYIICCSLIYPDKIHDLTDSLPLAYSRMVGDHERKNHEKDMFLLDQFGIKQSALDMSCFNKDNIWLSGDMLKLYLNLGMELKNVSAIVTYKVSDHLASFAKVCIEARRSAKNAFYARIAKAVPNLAVGKFQQKKESLRTVITTSKKQTQKYLSRRLFVDAQPLEPELALVTIKRKRTLPAKNVLISWHVLMTSVYQMYDFFYNQIKRVWGPRAYLLYAQTDSAIIRVSQADSFIADLEKLKHVLDLTTLPKDCSLYDPFQTGTEGKWKLEGFYVRQFLSLRQKSYSVLEELPECTHETGETCDNCVISRGIKKRKVCHYKYLDVLENKHTGSFSYKSLVQDREGNLRIQDNQRQFLSHGTSNRVWISPYESKPRGYRSIGV